MLLIAGSADDVSGYEKGRRVIFQGAVNADRYLLTFVNANHNAAAPMPAPVETYRASGSGAPPFSHYAAHLLEGLQARHGCRPDSRTCEAVASRVEATLS